MRERPNKTTEDSEDTEKSLVRVEPSQNSFFKFLRGRAVGGAVVSCGNFPKLSVGGECVNSAGVSDWNVAVDFTMDEKDWDVGREGGIFGRDLIHVEVEFPSGAKECDFDQRTKDGASEPGAEVERLSHAVVGDLAEIGEGGFDGDGAEVWMRVERLQELSCAHRFS